MLIVDEFMEVLIDYAIIIIVTEFYKEKVFYLSGIHIKVGKKVKCLIFLKKETY